MIRYVLRQSAIALTWGYWLPTEIYFPVIKYWLMFAGIVLFFFLVREWIAYMTPELSSWTMTILNSFRWSVPIYLSAIFFIYLFLFFLIGGVILDAPIESYRYYPRSYVFAAPSVLIAGVIFYWHLWLLVVSDAKVKASVYWFLNHTLVMLLLVVNQLFIFGGP